LAFCDARSAGDGPTTVPAPGARASDRGASPLITARQARSIDGWMPSSAATWVSGRPLPSSKATASRLNSGANSRLVLLIVHLPAPIRSVSKVSTNAREDQGHL